MARMLEALERARKERLKKAAKAVDRAVKRASTGEDGSEELSPSMAQLGEISELVIGAHDHQSPITEQIRQIRTNLETILADYRSKPIAVSSPVSGDGKSLFTANLATILADDPDRKVLLIDADMRKASQHALFGIRSAPGLSEVLRGRCSIEEAIHPTTVPNLKLMPAGRTPDLPSVLLGSERMLSMTSDLQRQYHWIVFDTPPILPVTDALVLGRCCIGLILVVRMDRTNRKVIERAQDVLAETRLPVLGCVLNDFDIRVKDKTPYYGEYYGRYGNPDSEGFKS